MHPVIVQLWTESERGWGQRPDGYSLHLTTQDQIDYVNHYWSKMPEVTPHEYSYDSGDYIANVDEETYNLVKASKNGIRRYDAAPPRHRK